MKDNKGKAVWANGVTQRDGQDEVWQWERQQAWHNIRWKRDKKEWKDGRRIGNKVILTANHHAYTRETL